MAEETGQGDAAAAFEALQAEVSSLRQGIELAYRQGQETERLRKADKALSGEQIGLVAAALKAVDAQLGVLAQKPALAMRVEEFQDRIHSGALVAAKSLEAMADVLGARLQGEAARLGAVVGQVEERERLTRRAWRAGLYGLGGGVGIGLAIWVLLVTLLPGGAGTWLAALPVAGGDRWAAGMRLLGDAAPDELAKMILLYSACGRQPAEQCKAGILASQAAKPAGPEDAPAVVTAPPPVRGQHRRE